MRHAGWLSITGVVIVVALALVVAASSRPNKFSCSHSSTN
jgi:hypothetical protein